jgi:hypothetical protein
MDQIVCDAAVALSRQHIEDPCLLFGTGTDVQSANGWRQELRLAGVPVLELNDASGAEADAWLDAARALSAEFFVPVVIFGGAHGALGSSMHGVDGHMNGGIQHRVDAEDWLRSRQVALTDAVERSPLNEEFRRQRGLNGWIRIGWQPAAATAEGNGLLLAWSSPLPLRRIRDFAARCPEITLIGPDAGAIAHEVADQGISVAGWRFAVK